jgi:hypothetical protein
MSKLIIGVLFVASTLCAFWLSATIVGKILGG